MPLWLHEASHNTINSMQGTITRIRHHGWDNGVIWPLVRRIYIWMTVDQDKICSSVLQRETTIFGNDSSTEATIITVDERATITFCISYSEIDGVRIVVS